ncbi:MAG TPA: sugar phosphate isomerase/epimerase family protein [Puia sp.]|jgi:sugar phosphate isomerase/epimerase|nr:sugar phosphate isomerase/epimerase family protein [Puia sp.]
MKFALLTVTYGGLFYKGQALSLEQQIRKAKDFGFDALAIETKRPVASPLDLNKADRNRIKKLAADEGIVLCAVESMSNFAGRHMEERENNLAMMRNVLEMAKDLGVDLVKIFAAWPGIINDEEEISLYGQFERGEYYKRLWPADLRKWNRCVEGIREVADMAADMGITLALQNHAPVLTKGYEDTLTMMKEINRKNVELCIDAPLFYERQSDEYIREAVENCRGHILHTHYGAWNFTQKKNGEIIQEPSPSSGNLINYSAFMEALYHTGYKGYLTSEYCLPVIKDHQLAGIEEVDHATRISLQYMKQLVQQAVLA